LPNGGWKRFSEATAKLLENCPHQFLLFEAYDKPVKAV
jgi:hypothetical protein